MTVVDAQVTEVDRVKEREDDGSGLVDGLKFGALTLGVFLAALESLREGLAIVDIDGDAKPMENSAGVVSNGLGANPHHQRARLSRARTMRASRS